jgi:hypothetical protein
MQPKFSNQQYKNKKMDGDNLTSQDFWGKKRTAATLTSVTRLTRHFMLGKKNSKIKRHGGRVPMQLNVSGEYVVVGHRMSGGQTRKGAYP